MRQYQGLLILDYDAAGLPIATYKSLSVADYVIPGDLQVAITTSKGANRSISSFS